MWNIEDFEMYLNKGETNYVSGYLNQGDKSLISTELKNKLKKKHKNLYNKHFNKGDYYEKSNKTFDEVLAYKYLNKLDNARKHGHEFTLTLTSMRNMLKAKKCYYTGRELTLDTITIDRVDNSKGYVSGNVVACHKFVNSFKGTIECERGLSFKEVVKLMKKWGDRV